MRPIPRPRHAIRARLYTHPADPVPLLGAAVSPETAARVARWADGLLTTGSKAKDIARVIEAFRMNSREGKPIHIQHALSCEPTRDAAL